MKFRVLMNEYPLSDDASAFCISELCLILSPQGIPTRAILFIVGVGTATDMPASNEFHRHLHNLPRFKNLFGTSTCFDRRNSATFFARMSYELEQLTPRSRWSWRRKCTADAFGSSNLSTLPPLYSSASNRLILSIDKMERSQSYSSL